MSRYLVDQIERSKGVEVHLNTEVRELRGDRVLEGLVIENNRTGASRTVNAKALFVFVGAAPGMHGSPTLSHSTSTVSSGLAATRSRTFRA